MPRAFAAFRAIGVTQAMLKTQIGRGWQALIAAVALIICSSCDGPLYRNQTAIRRGNVNFQFYNKTPYRASFSFGTYDALDLNPPGPVTLEQIQVTGNATSATVQVPCRRNAAVATQA